MSTHNVHFDPDTERALREVEIALTRQFAAEGKPYNPALLPNLVRSLALEVGAKALHARHCSTDDFQLEAPASPPQFDPVAKCRAISALFNKTEPRT